MKYLNDRCLLAISADSFRNQAPYPWIKMKDILMEEAFSVLCENMPDVSLFNRDEGVTRAHGQAPHDRYSLHYHAGLKLPRPWQEFLGELEGEVYQSFLRRMVGSGAFLLTYEWHYAWSGCSVSPHCDAARKIATHLLYFNEEENWDPSWGGQTLILDGGRRFRSHSSPGFDELRVAASSDPCGNNSLLFQRTPHCMAWRPTAELSGRSHETDLQSDSQRHEFAGVVAQDPGKRSGRIPDACGTLDDVNEAGKERKRRRKSGSCTAPAFSSFLS